MRAKWTSWAGNSQVKGIEFNHPSTLLLVAPTLRLIVATTDAYQIIIGIADVTNASHNTFNIQSNVFPWCLFFVFSSGHRV